MSDPGAVVCQKSGLGSNPPAQRLALDGRRRGGHEALVTGGDVVECVARDQYPDGVTSRTHRRHQDVLKYVIDRDPAEAYGLCHATDSAVGHIWRVARHP